jgi:endonuclease/exonuclease/phosphatase family metal-dependent hydrolase
MLVLLAVACTGPVDSGDSDGTSDSDTVAPVVDTITLGAFNVESGGSTAATVATFVTPVTGESLWGFEEVEDDATARVLVAAADDGGQDWQYVLGTTGYEDRLVLAWDDARFELIDSEELDDINVGGTARAPLVGHLRDRENDREFLYMVNHLWRTDDAKRHQQAELLNAWGADQTLPLVTAGDFNFDWAESGGEHDHDEGYDLLTADGVFDWIEPTEFYATECGNYHSILDFVFTVGDAQTWDASSEILDASNAYCSDPDNRSDHRPITATIGIPDR